MKRCPKCNRAETDNSLAFCRADGTRLVSDGGGLPKRKKQYAKAIAALEKARQGDANPSSLGYLGYVYAAAGKKAEALRVLDELKESSKRQYVPSYSIAIIYAGLNDKDKAFEWLNKAYDERSHFIALLKVETALDNLRPDPRFAELMRKVGLPQ